jgi:hypothetical protein
MISVSDLPACRGCGARPPSGALYLCDGDAPHLLCAGCRSAGPCPCGAAGAFAHDGLREFLDGVEDEPARTDSRALRPIERERAWLARVAPRPERPPDPDISEAEFQAGLDALFADGDRERGQ